MPEKKVLLFLLVFATFTASAQNIVQQTPGGRNPFMNDSNGMPLYQKTEYRADGSPYLYEDYVEAEITSQNGNVYKGVKIKINLAENKVLYLHEDGTEMIATAPVRQVKFVSVATVDAVQLPLTLLSPGQAINTAGAPIYQLLAEGRALLYKQIIIDFTDTKGYAEATVTRVFKRKEIFYARMPGPDSSLQKLVKTKASLLAQFPTQREKIETYMETHGLKGRSEKDLVAIFRFYNSLQ